MKCLSAETEDKFSYPRYLEIVTSDQTAKQFAGTYQLTDGDMPRYKKPHVSNYLYKTNTSWTISKEKTGDLYLLSAVCNLPTSDSCTGNWINTSNKKTVDLKITVGSDPVYPEFYEVSIETGEGKEDINELVGYYKKQPDLHLEFPVYKKTNGTVVLYFSQGGHWMFGPELGEERGLVRSMPQGTLEPQNNCLWQCWNVTGEDWQNDSSFYVAQFVHPESYLIKATEVDQEILEVFEREKLGGKYVRNYIMHSNSVTYVKEGEPVLNLYKSSSGNWSVSKFLLDGYSVMYQNENNSPAPVAAGSWLILDRESNKTLTTSNIEVIPDTKGRTTGPACKVGPTGSKNSQVIVFTILVTVAVVVFVAVAVVYVKKAKEPIEEPILEGNDYYGEEEEYYDEHANRMEDNNDYYGM